MAHVPSADRRRQFIEAASLVIEQDGVARATTRRIADEAGANLAALHYCFSTKEELFEAVSATIGRSNLSRAIESVRPGMGIAAAVDVVLHSMAKAISANLAAELGEIEISVWALRSGRSEMPRRTYDAWIELAVEALDIARAADEQDQDVKAIARMLTAFLDGCVRADLMTDRHCLEESADIASRTIVAAIAAGVFGAS